jgi:hypothetical protein
MVLSSQDVMDQLSLRLVLPPFDYFCGAEARRPAGSVDSVVESTIEDVFVSLRSTSDAGSEAMSSG